MASAAQAPQAGSVDNVVARIERIPTSWWHVKTRIIVGVATFFDAFDALAIATALPVLVPMWKLTPPQADPTCDDFSVVAGKPNEAVWRHADTDGCNHTTMGPAGHPGTVTVTVKTSAWECTATFFGTNTDQGPPARRCRRV